MNWKTITGITLVVAGALVAGVLVFGKSRSRPPLTVTIRVAVNPGDQADFVIAQANSARFKYMVGKQSGVKPILAQKLSTKLVPNSSLVEAQLRVLTKDEARRYVDAFVPTLQGQCGEGVKLALAEQSVR